MCLIVRCCTINVIGDPDINYLNFKNPYDTSAANPITKGGQYWYDIDVGYVRIHTESYTKLQVWVCAETPCGSKPHPNVYDAYTPIQ